MNNTELITKSISILAAKYDWNYLKTGDWVIIFYKNFQEDRAQINVYWNMKGLNNPNNMQYTVQTSLKHPKQGKTQLNRKNIGIKQLEEIFKNPRIHTGKGYYRK